MSGHKPALAAALESLEAGDLREAEAILLDALEDGPPPDGITCAGCGRVFAWPGLRDGHSAHCWQLAEKATR